MADRLASATSPYLLQHAENPVDWWEWGPEAFAEAKRRDTPILLSVGYAACHWCHVMAHESFEDESTAAYMNEHFVSIKVDREERPDVDAVYMAATTALTGQGGWPMTVFLDHEGSPFFAGTYFPPRPAHGIPAFTQLLQALSDGWVNRRDQIDQVAANVREHLAQGSGLDTAAGASYSTSEAVEALAEQFDPAAGGFGGAPKFPPSMVLEFLRRSSGDKARMMLNRTVAAMAGGGIYDQIGGGFARYSVDRGWVVPHFEKMLYDNGLLLGLYARLGTDLGDRIAGETADFMIRELRTPEGGFASALDADSEGEEGRFYVWTPAQLTEALGVERGQWAAEVFDVTEAGTFEHGTSTLQLRHAPTDPDELRRLSEVKARLLDVRAQRVRPARDDKVVAAWNGLAISGLVDAGLRLGREDLIEVAVKAGEVLVAIHSQGEWNWNPEEPESCTLRLLRVSRDGAAGKHAGVLEDYGCVAQAFLDLARATVDADWLARATALLDSALARFDAGDGGFFDTAADVPAAERLLIRPRDASDNASPSGTSAMIHALVTAHALTGESRFREGAEAALTTTSQLMEKAPRFAGHSLTAAALLEHGPEEIAVVGPLGPARDELVRAAMARPGGIVAVAGEATPEIPLLADRHAKDGSPTAYVCRGFVCLAPVTTVEDLTKIV
ncbi:thioredoxin domain-containing protein [Nocardioides sp. Kera G14]|uniref:thioredoxin domain-containing protein n=1 Tax=Nocardioides sp. Kera G14 TaxID=2884264 RepID=UPI001D10F77A|nr:thioredoxin domain-containing protein [Nocardioides sp. Kera G14]